MEVEQESLKDYVFCVAYMTRKPQIVKKDRLNTAKKVIKTRVREIKSQDLSMDSDLNVIRKATKPKIALRNKKIVVKKEGK